MIIRNKFIEAFFFRAQGIYFLMNTQGKNMVEMLKRSFIEILGELMIYLIILVILDNSNVYHFLIAVIKNTCSCPSME